MEPQRRRDGSSTINRARRPTEEDTFGEAGWSVVDEPVEATDPLAEAEMAARLPSTRKKLKQALDPRVLTPAQRRIKQTQVALALYTEGASINEIAADLGVSSATIRGWFATHRRKVTSDEIDMDLDQIAVPLAKENLIHGLLAGDKDYTRDVLKGRGHLRTKEAPPPPGEIPVLRVEFAFPTVALNTDVSNVGVIHGTPTMPKQIAGVVVDSQPLEPLEPVGIGAPRLPGSQP
jgi:hypothetical protein